MEHSYSANQLKPSRLWCPNHKRVSTMGELSFHVTGVYFFLHKLLLSNTCVFLITQTSIIKYICIACYTNFYYQIHVYCLLHKLLLSNTCVLLATQTYIIKYMCIVCSTNFYYQMHVYFLLHKLL
jgi:hypothetical protein